jgi:uncharacterized protein YceH (UPF0502 family)
VIESSGGRVMRYAENIKAVLQVPSESVGLLVTLILRGAQTAGELRIHCERIQRFSDISAVEGFLNELAAWPAGALAAELPRAPGARETRWVHLLSGPVATAPAPASALQPSAVSGPSEAAGALVAGTGGATYAPAPASVGELDAMNAKLARLEAEIAALKSTVERLCGELGVPVQRD